MRLVNSRLFIWLIFSNLRLLCAAQDYYFTHYQSFDQKDGYRVLEAPAYLMQDRSGLLWIGSDNGLLAFNGTHFTHYRHQRPDTAGLPANRVIYNYQDKTGLYWTSIPGHGLYNFSPRNGAFMRFRYRNEDTFNIHEFHINRPLETRSGVLWFPLFNYGLARHDRGQNKMVPYPVCPQGSCGTYYSASGISHLAEDPADGTLWAASNDGLVHFYPASGRFEVYRDKPRTRDKKILGDVYTFLFFDQQNQLWIGSWGWGLKKFDRHSKTFEAYRWNKAISGSSNICNGIGQLDANLLWINTVDAGLLLFDVKRHQFVPARKNGDAAEPLILNQMVQNGSGVLWGANGKNLVRINPAENNFRYHELDLVFKLTPTAHGIYAFAQSKGALFLGVIHDGFFGKYELETHRFTPYLLFPNLNRSIRCLATDANEQIWVGGSGGLHIFNPQTETFAKPLPEKVAPYITGTTVYDLVHDEDGTVWLGTSEGLVHYNPKQQTAMRYTYDTRNGNRLKDNKYYTHTQTLFRDSKGNIWFGNAVVGLGCYRKTTGKVTFFNKARNKAFTEGNCTSITEAKDGSIVFSLSTLGLFVLQHPFTPKETMLMHTTADGLPSDDIEHVFKDKDQNIWLFTTNGISLYDPATGAVRNFGKEDGLVETALYSKPFQDDSGNIYIGHAKSLQVFNPRKLLLPRYCQGNIHLASLQVNGKTWPLNPNLISALRLRHTQNNIAFTYAFLSQDQLPHFNYAYKLEGLDKNWMMVGTNTAGLYNNLSPGRYTLRIRAKGPNGIWVKNELRLHIIIAPPWYGTWWFYTLLALLTAGLLYALYRYRIQQILKLQAMRTRIASDLHDEIGSTLTSISFQSEMIKLQLDEGNKDVRMLLDKVGHNARNAVTAMNDIVWVINPANDEWEHLLARMKHHAADVCGERQIACHFEAAGPVHFGPNMLQRKNMYLIFKEALHNALKYACCSSVHIQVTHMGGNLCLRIADNGKGFEPAAVTSQGNGLENMKRRAAEIGGRLDIRSAPWQGTEIMMQLKIT